MKVGLLLRGTEDAVLNAVTESISDAVEEVRFSQMDVVGYALLRGFRWSGVHNPHVHGNSRSSARGWS